MSRNAYKFRRPTLGLLMGGLTVSEHKMWLGAMEAASAQRFNFVAFAGRALQSPIDFHGQSNVIYDLVNPELLSGIVVLSSGLGLYTGSTKVQSFVSRFRDLPLVSLGRVLPDIPTILADDYHGMREVVDHLTEVHQYRRIAFIRGPVTHEGAQERYRAYVESLADHDIPLDQDLVSPPSKGWSHQPEIEHFLSAFRLSAKPFEAIIGASANLGQQALVILRRRGLRIPEDVAVAGFDDFSFVRSVRPPMTTARAPSRAMGRRAVSMLAAQMHGDDMPLVVTIPAHLIVRQSCGCPSQRVSRATLVRMLPYAEASSDEEGPKDSTACYELSASQRESLHASIAKLVGDRFPSISSEGLEWIGALIDALASDMRDLGVVSHCDVASSSDFLSLLRQVLRDMAHQYPDVAYFQDVISRLRSNVLDFPLADDDYISSVQLRRIRTLEDLFGQARVMVSETVQTVAAAEKIRARRHIFTMRHMGHLLTTAVDLQDMMDILAEVLPGIGIRECYLVLYEDLQCSGGWGRLHFALSPDGRIDIPPEGWRFRTSALLPFAELGENLRLETPHSFIAEPLFVRDQYYGYMVVASRPCDILFEDEYAEWAGTVYDLLRGYLSDALHGVFLYDEARRARQQAEQADQLKSRFLSMVSHELRTPLNVIVSLSEMLLWEEDGCHQELKRIHASAQHLDGLIRDVLDLASSQIGELHLLQEPLDLAQSLKVVTLIGEQMAQDKGLHWRTEIADSLPTVWGDRTRIRQVALNLVSNAFRFTSEGEVRLRVEVGDGSVCVLVSDTGIGVPVDEQETIFDEFRQSERTTARGYGGLGLGLAISRRLVEMHGGNMGMRSSGVEGEGATFYFTLPLMDRAEVSPVAVEAGESGKVDAPVWVMSEQAGAGERLTAYLSDSGYQVEEIQVDDHEVADLSEHWLTRLGQSRPRAIILDLEPAQDRGWEVMKLIKDNPETQHIPVLFYSLLQDERSGSMLTLDYLSKPVSTDELVAALERQGVLTPGGGQNGSQEPDPLLDAQASKCFLVVDDEPDILVTLARLLQSRIPNSRVLKASNGEQALDLMMKSRPDLVLLDLMMPEMSGFEVIENMRQHPDLCDIPVMVLTAKTLTEDVMAQLDEGVATMLSKGLFSADETLRHVDLALRRSHQANLGVRRMVRSAMAYIHEHYMESMTRQDIAEHVGYSPRHLDRCFDEEMELTPMAYLNRFRLRQSRRLLESTSRDIGEIASAVGFSDSAYFSRVFKQETGMSPTEYRKTL